MINRSGLGKSPSTIIRKSQSNAADSLSLRDDLHSYGATTFPGLTEAMTIDKDPAAAQQEANELTDLIEKMASRLMA